jgi:tRNA1(Val) A37 N6-methylase TrmN6
MDTNVVTPAAIYEMRDFMNTCQDYNHLVEEIIQEMVAANPPSLDEGHVLTESMLVSMQSHPIMGDLQEVVDRLRAFMESSGGDYALGVEDGMQRAAEMIEILLKRHEGE